MEKTAPDKPADNRKGHIVMIDKERLKNAYQFTAALCYYADKDEEFRESFWKELCREEDILEEFCYYMENQKFACKVSIEGYTVIDIMVWQIDHFKAELDRSDLEMRDNGDKMLLMAFDTFLKMRKEPEKYVWMMQEETGTDYPEKY